MRKLRLESPQSKLQSLKSELYNALKSSLLRKLVRTWKDLMTKNLENVVCNIIILVGS